MPDNNTQGFLQTAYNIYRNRYGDAAGSYDFFADTVYKDENIRKSLFDDFKSNGDLNDTWDYNTFSNVLSGDYDNNVIPGRQRKAEAQAKAQETYANTFGQGQQMFSEARRQADEQTEARRQAAAMQRAQASAEKEQETPAGKTHTEETMNGTTPEIKEVFEPYMTAEEGAGYTASAEGLLRENENLMGRNSQMGDLVSQGYEEPTLQERAEKIQAEEQRDKYYKDAGISFTDEGNINWDKIIDDAKGRMKNLSAPRSLFLSGLSDQNNPNVDIITQTPEEKAAFDLDLRKNDANQLIIDYAELSKDLEKTVKSSGSQDPSAERNSKFWAGFLNTRFSDVASAGLTDMTRSLVLYNIAKKASEGQELLPEERGALMLFASNQELNQALADSWSFQFGSGARGMAEFMANMALTGGFGGVIKTGTKAAGRAAAKVLDSTIKTYSKEAIRAKVRQLPGMAASNMVRAALMPLTWKEVGEGYAGLYDIGYDENGRVTAKRNEKSEAGAVWKPWASNAMMNFTFSVFGNFNEPIMDYIMSSSVMRNASEQVLKLTGKITKNPVYSKVGSGMDKIGLTHVPTAMVQMPTADLMSGLVTGDWEKIKRMGTLDYWTQIGALSAMMGGFRWGMQKAGNIFGLAEENQNYRGKLNESIGVLEEAKFKNEKIDTYRQRFIAAYRRATTTEQDGPRQNPIKIDKEAGTGKVIKSESILDVLTDFVSEYGKGDLGIKGEVRDFAEMMTDIIQGHFLAEGHAAALTESMKENLGDFENHTRRRGGMVTVVRSKDTGELFYLLDNKGEIAIVRRIGSAKAPIQGAEKDYEPFDMKTRDFDVVSSTPIDLYVTSVAARGMDWTNQRAAEEGRTRAGIRYFNEDNVREPVERGAAESAAPSDVSAAGSLPGRQEALPERRIPEELVPEEDMPAEEAALSRTNEEAALNTEPIEAGEDVFLDGAPVRVLRVGEDGMALVMPEEGAPMSVPAESLTREAPQAAAPIAEGVPQTETAPVEGTETSEAEQPTEVVPEVELPRQKNGEVDYDALMVQNPLAFVAEVDKVMGEGKGMELLQKNAEKISADIEKVQASLEKEVSPNKVIANTQKLSQLQDQLKIVNAVLKPEETIANEVEETLGEDITPEIQETIDEIKGEPAQEEQTPVVPAETTESPVGSLIEDVEIPEQEGNGTDISEPVAAEEETPEVTAEPPVEAPTTEEVRPETVEPVAETPTEVTEPEVEENQNLDSEETPSYTITVGGRVQDSPMEIKVADQTLQGRLEAAIDKADNKAEKEQTWERIDYDEAADIYRQYREKYGDVADMAEVREYAIKGYREWLNEKIEEARRYDGIDVPEDLIDIEAADKAFDAVVAQWVGGKTIKPQTGQYWGTDYAMKKAAEEAIDKYVKAKTKEQIAKAKKGKMEVSPDTPENNAIMEDIKKREKKKFNPYNYVAVAKKGQFSRPVMEAVFYDKKNGGWAVVSDAHILIASKDLYDPKLADKKIDKKGNEVKGEYPAWQKIFRGKDAQIPLNKDYVALYKGVQKIKEAKKALEAKEKGSTKNMYAYVSLGEGMAQNYYSVENLEKFLDAAVHFGIKPSEIFSYGKNRPIGFDTPNVKGLLMPARISQYGAPLFVDANGELRSSEPYIREALGLKEDNSDTIREQREISEPQKRRYNPNDMGIRNAITQKIQKAGIPVITDETGQAILNAARELDVRKQVVMHGSGALFDRFDHSFMGTGEGLQAYGWGTYVTEVPGVAKHYAQTSAKVAPEMREEYDSLQKQHKEAAADARHAAALSADARDAASKSLLNLDSYNYLQSLNDAEYAEFKRRMAIIDEKYPEGYEDSFSDVPPELQTAPKIVLDAMQFLHTSYGRVYDLRRKNGETDKLREFGEELERHFTEDSEFHKDMAKEAGVKRDKQWNLFVKLQDPKFQKNSYLYEVEIPNDNGNNYITYNKELSAEQKRQLKDAIRERLLSDPESGYNEKNLRELNEDLDISFDNMYGNEVEGTVRDWLGMSDKEASEFLSGLGYVGIKYPAQYRSGGREDGTSNYVIFNEDDLKIQSTVKLFKSKDGKTIYGFTKDGKIYLDPSAPADTPIHEYAHIWFEMFRKLNPKEAEHIIDLMKDTPLWEDVKKNYPELTSEMDLAEEVLAHYSGKRGAERLRAEMKRISSDKNLSASYKLKALRALENLRKAIEKFWRAIAEYLGIKFTTAEEVADRILADIDRGLNPREVLKTVEASRPMFTKAEEVLDYFNSRGFKDGKIDRSITDHGVSVYITGRWGLEPETKYRISDHGLGAQRAAHEIQFSLEDSPEAIFRRNIGWNGRVYERSGAEKLRAENYQRLLEENKEALAGLAFKVVQNSKLPLEEFVKTNEEAGRAQYIQQRVNKDGTFNYEYSYPEPDEAKARHSKPSISFMENFEANIEVNPSADAARDLYNRYENQDGEKLPWMSQDELIDQIEKNIPRGEETKELYSLIDKYHELDEEDLIEGRRDFSGGEKEDVFDDILGALNQMGGQESPIRMQKSLEDEDMEITENGINPLKGFIDEVKRVNAARAEQRLISRAEANKQKVIRQQLNSNQLEDLYGGTQREAARRFGRDLFRMDYQDSDIFLRRFQEMITRRGGKIDSSSDFYNMSNHASSIAAGHNKVFMSDFYEPMVEVLGELRDKLVAQGLHYGEAQTSIDYYLIAKHAPERNREICVREIEKELRSRFGSEISAGRTALADSLSGANAREKMRALIDYDKQIRQDLRTLAETAYDSALNGTTFTATLSRYGSMLDGADAMANVLASDIFNSEQGNNRSGLTDEKANEIVYLMEKENKDVCDRLWEKIRAATDNIVEDLYFYGLIDASTRKQLKSGGLYSNYVPLRGWEDSEDVDYTVEGPTAGFLNGGMTNPVKQAKGRTSIADNPIAQILALQQAVQSKGAKNLVRITAFNAMIANPGQVADFVDIDTSYTILNDTGGVERVTYEKPEQRLFDEGRVIINGKNSDYGWHRTDLQQMAHQVPFIIGGTRQRMTFKGTAGLAVAMTLRGDNMKHSDLGLLGKGTRFIARTQTSLNPKFIFGNLTRDAFEGFVTYYTQTGHRLGSKDFFSSMKEVFRYLKAELEKKDLSDPKYAGYREFVLNGGATGFMQGLNLERIKKEMENIIRDTEHKSSLSDRLRAGKFIRGYVNILELLGGVSENVMRYAAYKKERQAGKSAFDAATMAKNLTVNFNRKGANIGWLSALYAFINPTIQGNHLILHNLRRYPKRFLKAIGLLTAVAFTSSLLSSLMGDDDKDEEGKNPYDRISDYTRYSNLIILNPWQEEGKTQYMMIPMSHGLKMFTSLGAILADVVRGYKTPEEGIRQWASLCFGEAVGSLEIDRALDNPNNPLEGAISGLVPTAVKPLAEVAVNKNFMGGKIYKDKDNIFFSKITPEYKMVYGNKNQVLIASSKWINKMAGGMEDLSGRLSVSEEGFIEESQEKTILSLFNNPSVQEHLFNGYFGGITDFLFDVVNTAIGAASTMRGYSQTGEWETQVEANDVPILNKFYRSNKIRMGYDNYYAMQDEIKMYDSMAKEGLLPENINSGYYEALKLLNKKYKKSIDAAKKNRKAADNAGDDEAMEQYTDEMEMSMGRLGKEYQALRRLYGRDRRRDLIRGERQGNTFDEIDNVLNN